MGAPVNTGRPEAGAHYAALYNEAMAKNTELEKEVARLLLLTQPRSVREVISFAHVEEMSTRQLSDVLTAQHEELVKLREVVQKVALAFDGGPDHPWIPGYDAKPIYHLVMAAVKN